MSGAAEAHRPEHQGRHSNFENFVSVAKSFPNDILLRQSDGREILHGVAIEHCRLQFCSHSRFLLSCGDYWAVLTLPRYKHRSNLLSHGTGYGFACAAKVFQDNFDLLP